LLKKVKSKPKTMGVYHLSGMGRSPGAVTVPLTYVYLLLHHAEKGNNAAVDFFGTSGERDQDKKGAPEYLIVFTSKEVIEQTKQGKIESDKMKDDWFKTTSEFPQRVPDYLNRLWVALSREGLSPFYEGNWIKGIYFVEVNHLNFERTFERVASTVYALREKELWINMIGGVNQINIALLIAGTFYLASTRYYYVFQENTSLLHPEGVTFSKTLDPSFVRTALDKWHEFPLVSLEMGKFVTSLAEKLKERGSINIGELELEKYGLPKQAIPKLRGTLVTIEGDRVSEGPRLRRIAELERKTEKIDNFSEWKKRFGREGVLYEYDERRMLVRVQ